jgi:hypothetical protein
VVLIGEEHLAADGLSAVECGWKLLTNGYGSEGQTWATKLQAYTNEWSRKRDHLCPGSDMLFRSRHD